MNLKEIFHRMFYSFFVILSCSLIGSFILQLILKKDGILYPYDIIALILLSIATSLSYLFFYSRKELYKIQMIVRYIIHLIYVSSLMLFTAIIMRWINRNSILQITVFLILVVLVYLTVIVIGNYQSRKTADLINKKLKERYKK